MTQKTELRGESAILKGEKKVLIVDDHPLFREGIARYINREKGLMVCGEAGNIDDAMAGIDALSPDLVTVDISLKHANGVELVKMIQARWPEMAVLVLSMHDESLYAERVLRAGARGYVMKQADSQQVMEAIRTVLKGRMYVSDEMQQRMLEKQIQGATQDQNSVEMLSDRELEVFQMIGQGTTTAQIAKGLHLSVKTIETYRAHIKTKLGLENNTELIRHAVEWYQREGGPAQ